MTPAVRPAAIRIPDAGGRTGSILFLLAWAGLLLLRDGAGNVFGIAYTVGIIVLNIAVVPWSMLRRDRKIARASRAAAGIAGTGEQQGQPIR